MTKVPSMHFLSHSNLGEQEEDVTFPVFKKLYPLENDLIDTVCAIWLDYTIEDSCMQQSIVNKDSNDIAVTALLQAILKQNKFNYLKILWIDISV